MNVATIFPLWPGNVGLAAGGGRAAARALRRPVRPRLRVRHRPAGDRDVGRRRRRARLPRARGDLVRDAAAHAGGARRTSPRSCSTKTSSTERVRVGARAVGARARRPASLKGVLTAGEAAAALAEGFRGRGLEVDEVPVADGGEGTMAVLARRPRRGVALGARSPTRSGGRSRRAGSSSTTGRPSSRRRRRSGWAASRRPSATRCGRRAAASASCCSRRSRTAPTRLLVCLGGIATVDGGRGLLELFGGFPVPVTVACDVRSPLLGPRGAARAYGPQKGADASRRRGARGAAGRARRPGALRPPAGRRRSRRARRRPGGARRRARPGRRARPRAGSASRAARGRRPRRDGRGDGRRDDLRGQGAGGGARPLRARRGVRCVVFGGASSTACPRASRRWRSAATRRGRAEDLVGLGARG